MTEQAREKRGRANEPIDRQPVARGHGKGKPGEKPIETSGRASTKRPAPAEGQEVGGD